MYWLFKEVWIFNTEEDRVAAAKLCKRMSATLRSVASKYGYDVDSVGDLTRVLRLPGTLNHKYVEPRKIQVGDNGRT